MSEFGSGEGGREGGGEGGGAPGGDILDRCNCKRGLKI